MGDIPLPNGNDEAEFERLIAYARKRELDPLDASRLAEHLANSGQRLAWPSSLRTVDIASTGGPGSLSTLIPPFILSGLGCVVVKLGVPGRPAGAIDSLATLPGYRPRLSLDEVRSLVTTCGFAHFLADKTFAPMDAALFAYRRKVGALSVPLLAAGSLLAKKVAVGVRTVGLDVRVGPHGNFGATADVARQNAQAFCQAARNLGINAVAFLSSGNGPMQPLIGRGEALVALAVSAGLHFRPTSSWLDNHIAQCHQMAQAISSLDHRAGQFTSLALPKRGEDLVRNTLEAHLLGQGSSIVALRHRVAHVADSQHFAMRAATAGVLNVDLDIVRDALVRVQRAVGATGDFHDPAGIELLIRPGHEVQAGDELARVRCDDDAAVSELMDDLRPAFVTFPRQTERQQSIGLNSVEVVRG